MEKSAANGDQDASLGDSNNSENGDENGDAENARSDDELTGPIKSEAETIEVENEIKDNGWAFDVSVEAVKAPTKELPSDLKRSLVLEDDDDEADGPSVYEQLGSWIAETAEEKGGVTEVSDIDFCKKAKEFGIESSTRPSLCWPRAFSTTRSPSRSRSAPGSSRILSHLSATRRLSSVALSVSSARTAPLWSPRCLLSCSPTTRTTSRLRKL